MDFLFVKHRYQCRGNKEKAVWCGVGCNMLSPALSCIACSGIKLEFFCISNTLCFNGYKNTMLTVAHRGGQ